ncbi:MAG: cysteine synthase family protein, partial [Opitutaceae bacterium]|nr:cysteine synthase family protein [Opitutaceae bacterium]
MSSLASSPALDTQQGLRRYNDIRELIGSPDNPTPLVRLNRVIARPDFPFYLKLEWFNPFGSVKDRTASHLLRGLERRGALAGGKQLVEPTSGNTGIALAALAALRGVKLTVTIPDGVPEEKKVLIRMLGAEVWETPDDLCPINHPKDGAIALAMSFVTGEATKDHYVMPNQYENPDNVAAHYETTGPEIWRQTEGKIRYFFAGYGTCGTITGVAKFLKERDPSIQIIAIEPQKGHRIPGLKNFKEARQPAILDSSLVDHVIQVNDEPAYATTKRLFREEGLIVGPSTGAIVHAAAEFAKDHAGLAVGISPDNGIKYASYF